MPRLINTPHCFPLNGRNIREINYNWIEFWNEYVCRISVTTDTCVLVEIWDKNISYGLGSEAFLAPYLGSWQIHADFFLNSSDPAVKAV